MSDSGPDRYCRARLRGLGDVDAAREAGYASRAPGEARRLWHRVEVLADEPGNMPSEQSLEDEILMLRAKMGRLRQQMQDAREWLRAVRIVGGE